MLASFGVRQSFLKAFCFVEYFSFSYKNYGLGFIFIRIVMSQFSPINDFDAYKHEWDKGFSHQDNSNKFSLNNTPKQSKKIPQLDFSSFTFIHYVCALCLMVFVVGFIFPKVNYYLAYNPVTVHSFPYTVITSSFVHYGFFHIIFNLFALYYIGV